MDHTTIYRWVQRYAPQLDKRCRPHLKPTNDSYRVDETYVKVKGSWKYLYRAVIPKATRSTSSCAPNGISSREALLFQAAKG